MAVESSRGVKPGEHPLMSNRTLKAMYAGMVRARVLLGRTKAGAGQRAALADVAGWAAGLVGLNDEDAALGCRGDGVLEAVLGRASGPQITGGTERLYGALGTAFAVGKGRVVIAFFERHEAGGAGWNDAMKAAAGLPVVIVVLARWKGVETDVDLCREARKAGVPGIAVDGQDAKALYRVARESLGRARADGGAALIEAVTLPDGVDAAEGLGSYLLARKIATRGWMNEIGPRFSARLDRSDAAE